MSHGSAGSNKLPVPYKPDLSRPPAHEHHTREWVSGARGGGYVPEDFEWGTNPKHHQEECGTNAPQAPQKP